MKVSRFVFNMFGINTYVLWDPESLEAAIVDPGMISPEEEQAISGFITLNYFSLTVCIRCICSTRICISIIYSVIYS